MTQQLDALAVEPLGFVDHDQPRRTSQQSDEVAEAMDVLEQAAADAALHRAVGDPMQMTD